jgi:predicted Zn-dependent protease
MERLKTALAADPENVELRENLARGYRSAGQVKEAARLLQEAPPGAGAHPRLLMLRAELDLESGQPFNAVSTLERLVASQPGSADAHFMLANAFAAAKNATGMKEQLIAGCRIDRDSGLAGPTLELVFRSLPDTAAKRALAEELKGLGGEVPGLDLAQARLDLAEGQFQQGLGRLVSLNKTRPTDRAVLVELIGAQAKGGDLFSATQSAQTWLKRHPKDPQVTGLLAQLYLKRGRTDKAIDTYRELLAALPQDPVANNNLANLLLPTDPATALTHARKASASAPGDPAIADTLGQALLAAGDAKGAVEALAQAQAGLPNEPAVALHYASALAAAGDRARAKSVLLPILDKSFPEKAQAQALLATLVGR